MTDLSKQALSDLIRDNQLEQLDVNLFRGRATHDTGRPIYGGQVVAQAISAAQQSVDKAFSLHSFHSYFLRPGVVSLPIIYEVDPIRDGRSFVTRSIIAKQKGRAIFNSTLSFQRPEKGLNHQSDMPQVQGPDGLASDSELYKVIFPDSDYGWPLEFRQVEPPNFSDPQPLAPQTYTWFKTADKLPDDARLHQQLLAYASDNPILVTALRPHGLTPFSPGVMTATIDHSLWFHRSFRVDEWLLFEAHSDSASNGRGISHGKIFSRDGELVASAMQEGLVRHKSV